MRHAAKCLCSDYRVVRLHSQRAAVLKSRFDAELESALRRADGGGDAGSGKRRRQVVVLGAGMDTRPWRHGYLRGAEAGSYKVSDSVS